MPAVTLSRRPRWWWTTALVGCAVCALFISFDALQRLHSIHGTFPHFEHWRFNADADRGFAEITGYLVMLVAAGALAYAWRRGPGRLAYAALALIIVAIVADDALELHERGGSALWQMMGWRDAGIRAQDMGELAVWGLIAAPLAVFFVVAWLRGSAEIRRGCLPIVVGLAVMLGFAAGIDLLGPATGPDGLNWHRRVRYALRLTEYAGEFLAMVAVCLAALRIATRPSPQRPGSVRQRR